MRHTLLHSRIVVAVVLCGLCGCGENQPRVPGHPGPVTPVRKLPEDKFVHSRFGHRGCFVDLKDGTHLSLFRVERAGQQEHQYEILICHSIELDKQRSYKPVNPKQQPLKSLSLTLQLESPRQSDWISFPPPHEDGEMSLLRFKYTVIVTTNSPDSPIQLKVESEAETYTIDGPPISSFTRLRSNPRLLYLERVPE